MADVLERMENEDGSLVILRFECPGCGCNHSFCIKSATPFPVWQWNGSMDRPTFSPSLLVWGSRPEARCHSFVRDGMIEFLHDCAHKLAGKTVPLPPVEA